MIRSEFAQWRDELEPPPRLSLAERIKAAWSRPAPEPDHFQWRRPGDEFPEIAERAALGIDVTIRRFVLHRRAA